MTTEETTDAALARLEALEAKATPGPWETVNGQIYINNCFDAFAVRPDGTLIAALRNDALPLLRRLQSERDALQSQVNGFKAEIAEAWDEWNTPEQQNNILHLSA